MQMSEKTIKTIYDFGSILLNAVLTVTLIFTFLFKISVVNGSSMAPTLSDADQVLMTAKDWKVESGDVIVISQPNDYNEVLIKRVIATEGQSVYIDATLGHVVVDGQLLNEPYIAEKLRVAGDMNYPVTVPEGHVFVMGDNRNYSGDSRFNEVGFIDTRYIVGEAVYRIGDTHLLKNSLENSSFTR